MLVIIALVIAETKLNDTFLVSDRSRNRHGVIIYIREDIPSKRFVNQVNSISGKVNRYYLEYTILRHSLMISTVLRIFKGTWINTVIF